MRVVAAVGETNVVAVADHWDPDPSARYIEVRDTAGLVAGNGCRMSAVDVAVCDEGTNYPGLAVLLLGDGNDRVTGFDVISGRVEGGAGDDVIIGAQGGTELLGGSGDDTLVGGDGGDRLDGGSGADTMRGGSGLDTFVAGAEPDGADRMVGGANEDEVDYAARTAPVVLDLAGGADDGVAGERDAIGSDIEVLRGGSGADRVIGNAKVNSLFGGAGEDLLEGGGGADGLIGEEGNDRLRGGTGDDLVHGQEGADRVLGGAGRDVLHGGEDGDRLFTRDGSTDDVACEGGRDIADLDIRDFATLGCERTRRKGTAAAVLLRSFDAYRLARGGVAASARIGCPADGPSRCRGTLSLTVGPRRHAAVRFSVLRGHRKAVNFYMSRAAARAVDAGKRFTVSLKSRDRYGRLRVLRNTVRFSLEEDSDDGPGLARLARPTSAR